MSEMRQRPNTTDLRPRLTVIGVGGAGCNAINNMIGAGLKGVNFVVANTDAQSLAASSTERRIQLGVKLTEGLGAGSRPEIGEAAAQEAIDDIRAEIAGSHMVFIAAGMGGGTGTGAASVIARVSRELGILTVAVVTKPFQFEGARRMRIAEAGIIELRNCVDTLIVIPNQNLFRIANDKTTFAEAFILADQVLYSGVACIVDLIVKEGLINLDFADVRTVMAGMGTAMMGTGEAKGERRAIVAAEEAISNPLLDDVTLKGAKGLLLSITGGRTLTLYEVDEAATRVRQEVDPEANIIVGATFDEALDEKVRVSIVASGMARMQQPASAPMPRADTEPARPSPTPAAYGVPTYAAPPPASPLPTAFDEDIQRRLSRALYGDAPEAEPGQAYPGQVSQAPYQTQPNPGVWHGPGNVRVEDEPALSPAPRGRAPRMTDGYSPSLGQESFAPMAPVEPRRGGRRMPDVEDFPIVGQRDYMAKKSTGRDGEPGYAGPAAGAAEPTPRKPGFFERLTGKSRREGESPAADSQRGSRPADPADQSHASLRNAARATGDHAGAGPDNMQDTPILPVFFGSRR